MLMTDDVGNERSQVLREAGAEDDDIRGQLCAVGKGETVGREVSDGTVALDLDFASGDGAAATKELGEYQMKWWIDSVVKAIQQVKADDVSLKLQKEFYEKTTQPLDTQP